MDALPIMTMLRGLVPSKGTRWRRILLYMHVECITIHCFTLNVTAKNSRKFHESNCIQTPSSCQEFVWCGRLPRKLYASAWTGFACHTHAVSSKKISISGLCSDILAAYFACSISSLCWAMIRILCLAKPSEWRILHMVDSFRSRCNAMLTADLIYISIIPWHCSTSWRIKSELP